MTTQPRGISQPGIHPSQPQLIPNQQQKFNPQQQFYNSPHQAYSPRQFAPSSPHLPQQYIPQPNIPNSTHELSKTQGVSGTPPTNMMMMPPPQQFYSTQNSRPRAPLPPGNPPYYPQYAQSGIIRSTYQSTAPPPTSPSYNTYHHPQYPYMQPVHQQTPSQMYNTQMQYTQPPGPPQHMTPPMQTQTMQQPVQMVSDKRTRKIITIKDPNTKEDMTENILKGANKARQESLSTPPSGRSSATPPNSDIPAQFAAQVMAAAAGNVKQVQGVSPLAATKQMDAYAANPPQMMQQIQADPQRVGSPMMPPTNAGAYSGMQQPQIPLSSSPRPQPMIPGMGMPAQGLPPAPYGMPQPPPQYSQGMISSSPSHTVPMPPPPMNPTQFQVPVSDQQQQTPLVQPYHLPPLSQTNLPAMPHKQPIRPVTNSIPDAPHQQPMMHPAVHSVQPPRVVSPAITEALTHPSGQSMLPEDAPSQQTLVPSHTAAMTVSPALKQPVLNKAAEGAVSEPSTGVVLKQQPTETETVQAPPAQVQSVPKEVVESKPVKTSSAQDSKKSVGLGQSVPKAEMDSESIQEKPVAAVQPEPAAKSPAAPMSYASKASAKPAPIQKTVQVKPSDTEEAIAPETVVPDPVKPGQVPPKEDTAIRLPDKDSGPQTNIVVSETAIEKVTEKLQPETDKSPGTKEEIVDETKPLDKLSVEVVSKEETGTTESSTMVTGVTEAGKGEPLVEDRAQPVKKTINPQINVLPATPVAKAPETLPKTEEVKAPTPSAKTVVQKQEVKPEPPPVQTKVSKTTEKSSRSTRVISPDGSSQTGKVVKKEVSDIKSHPKTDVTSQAKKSTSDEKTDVVMNGNISGASPESDVVDGKEKSKKSDSVSSPATPKTSKKSESKSTSESRSSQPKDSSSAKSTASDKATPDKGGSQSEKSNGVVEKSKTPMPDLKYQDDQWSPHNPKGKKQYNPEFLLQLQFQPTSLQKPKDLPNIDIVLNQPHKVIPGPMQPMELRSGTDFIPQYMQRGPGRQSSQGHRRSSRPGPTMSGQKIPKKIVSIDRTEVELKRTANAWKPAKLDAATANMSEAKKETAEVLRDVRAILNKLTPSKFADLMKQVLSLKIDTEEKLRGAIDLIFEKAIDEPNFSETYANMCRNMTSLRVTAEVPPDSESPGQVKTVEFRKLLLTRCQREFEKDKSEQEHLQEIKEKMEKNTDETLAAQLKEDYEMAESKERRRTQGNIRFIGELFKLQMLTESIMHNCIMSLFKARDDDHLESLCRLLMTIGKGLDHPKGKLRMDQYFEQIQKIIREKKTSSRVRFMLQDIQDLRLNNWVPRAITVQGPKTIDQIHQDAKEEQELMQLKIATAPPITPGKQSNRPGNRMGSRGHGGDDGWTHVPVVQKPTRYDPSKMKLKTNQFDESKVTLGGSQAFRGWKSGSGSSSLSRTGSGGYSPSASMDRSQETGRSNTPTSMMNRFSALSQGQMQTSDYEYQRRQGGRQSSREGTRSGSRGSMGPPQSGGRTPRKDERTSLLETARKMTSADRSGFDARHRSRESSPSIRPRPTTPQTAPHKYNTDLNEEKMEAKSKGIILEFLDIVDFKEATECLEELNAPPPLLNCFVYQAHELTFEKKATDRINIGKLMAHLLKRARISVKNYLEGLGELLKSAPDYEIDIPKVWEYFADQMSPVFQERETEVTFSCLETLSAPLYEASKAGIFVAELLKGLLKQVPMSTIATRWHEANMQWSKLLQTNDEKVIQEFLSRHNLKQLSSPSQSISESPLRAEEQIKSESYRTPTEEGHHRYESGITKLLKSKTSNDNIFDWVEANVSKADRIKSTFIRALTTSVCKNAVYEDKKQIVVVSKEAIKERCLLLQKFLENDPDRELQALYALQSLMVFLEQPPNILRTFLEVLYDEDIISETSFCNWEQSKDPNEQEGRGVVMASANPFFTWLRSAEPESD